MNPAPSLCSCPFVEHSSSLDCPTWPPAPAPRGPVFPVADVAPLLERDGLYAGAAAIGVHLTLNDGSPPHVWFAEHLTGAQLVERLRALPGAASRIRTVLVTGLESATMHGRTDAPALARALQEAGYRVHARLDARTHAHVGAGFDHVRMVIDLNPYGIRVPTEQALAAADELECYVRSKQDLETLPALLELTRRGASARPIAVVLVPASGYLLDPCREAAMLRGWRVSPQALWRAA
jgi:hypothetical protein